MDEYEKFAILISILSIAIATLALGWNIYRDVILKPKLKVRFRISRIIHGEYKSPSKLSISATNFGPGKIKCNGIDMKYTPIWMKILRKGKYATIIHDYNDPYSTKLPCELDVGDTCRLFLPFDKDCFLAEPCTHIGVCDTFDRIHWAPKKDLKKAKKEYYEKFRKNK